uniref:oleoyl-[acyl-carrier-protein] hydrolase n=1 Tax=Rhinopithecus bieti TaxID=61621 RepID=A0A2K6M6Z8_RHIBE
MDRGDQGRPLPCAIRLLPPSQGGSDTVPNENIFNCLYKNPEATFKLICFPWAGGGSVHFAKWGQDTHDSLEVHSLRLPGRESRIEEPFANDISQLVDEVVCALQPVIQDKQFAFFGHRYLISVLKDFRGVPSI